MNAPQLSPDRQSAGCASRAARPDDHDVATLRPATGVPTKAWAQSPPPRAALGVCSDAAGLAPPHTERVHIEKASTCQRRSRGDARGASGGGRNARRLTLVCLLAQGGGVEGGGLAQRRRRSAGRPPERSAI